MSDLIERLKQSEGPDRELDGELHLKVHPEGHLYEWYHSRDGEAMLVDGAPAPYSRVFDHPRYTASLDAALALVEEVLPDAVWTISSNENGYAATLYKLILEDDAVRRRVVGQLSASFSSPAIALLIALLQAVQATGDTGS